MAKTTRLTGGLYIGAVLAGTVAVAVLVNVLSARLFARVDLTENRLNTLSDASIEAVRALDDLEVTVYVSPDLPETVRDEMGQERVMRDVAQKLRDKVEEYRSYSDGAMSVRYVTEDVVEQARKAKLQIFSGEEATAREGRLQFKEYALGLTLSYKDAVEVLPLALYPEHYEFELTKRLLRLKEKVESAKLMKDVLRAGERVGDAVAACDERIAAAEPKGDEPANPFGLLSAEQSEARATAYRAAAADIAKACDGLAEPIAKAGALQGKHPALDAVVEGAKAFEALLGQFRASLTAGAADAEQAQANPLALASQLHAVAGEVSADRDDLEDAPGRKRIGFVCAGGAFCPFPDPTPLVPRELEGMIGQQNPFAAQVVGQLQRMEERINLILTNVQRNLFARRGFDIARVDLAEAVPTDVSALVLLGPRRPLSDAELYRLDQFVLGGGSLVVLLNAWDVSLLNFSPKGEMSVTSLGKNTSNIGDLLASWGVTPGGDLVVEPREHDTVNVLALIRQGQLTWQTQRAFPYPLLPVFSDFDASSPLVRGVPSLTLPFASSLALAPAEGREVKWLVRSSAQAARTTDPAFPLEPNAQLARVATMAPEGPLVVAATVTGKLPSHFKGKDAPALQAPPAEGEDAPAKPEPARRDDGEGRVLVLGSNLGLEDLSRATIFEGFSVADLTNANVEIIEKFRQWGANVQNWEVRLGQIQHTLPDNLQLLFNVLDWSIQNEALVEIRSKQYQRRPLEQLDEGQQAWVKVAAVALAPLLFVLFGLARWAMRRVRRRRLTV